MRVEELTSSDREAAVDVLAEAFHDYPVMRYMVGSHPQYAARLSSLIGFYCDKRLVCDWPVLGIKGAGEMVAVALVSEPSDIAPPDMSALERRLAANLGEAALGRMQRFEQASDGVEPSGPHHFVGMLGVRPGHQGKGYGARLVQWVKDRSVAAGSAGVALTTEVPENVPLYEHMGFDVVAQADVEELHTWCMRWSNNRYRGK